MALRKMLLVSIDDLLAVMREFLNPEVSRSGRDRCLRRHGVGNLRDLQAQSSRPKHKAFKAYEPGHLHVDVKYLPQMADESSRRHLFIAIDRATRWVFVRFYKSKTAANAAGSCATWNGPARYRSGPCLRTIARSSPTACSACASVTRPASTSSMCFAATSASNPALCRRSTQTNGMVERFNCRIEELLQSHHYRSGEEPETTLHRYVLLYNQQLPQSARRPCRR